MMCELVRHKNTKQVMLAMGICFIPQHNFNHPMQTTLNRRQCITKSYQSVVVSWPADRADKRASCPGPSWRAGGPGLGLHFIVSI